MGRILTIRVSAQTYRPEDVLTAWPKLFRLVFPLYVKGDPVHHGVLEFARAVEDVHEYGDWPAAVKERMRDSVTRLSRLRIGLEEALAARKPAEADHLSYDLEDTLDDLEKTALKN